LTSRLPVQKILALSAISILCIQAAPSLAQVRPDAAIVQFSEVGLAISQPPGFEKAQAFYGFQQSKTGSSVVLSSLPGSFNQVIQKFDSATLQSRGLKLVSKSDITIGGQSGVLLQVAQSAYGQTYLKWIAIFGNSARTYFVTASFPAQSDPALSNLLKQTVQSVSIIKTENAKTPTFPFRIEPVAGLIPAPQFAAMGKAAAFTKDGKVPPTSPNDPLFIVSPSLGPVPVLDQRLYALRRIKQVPKIPVKTINSTAPITVDGLSGYEILATGTDQDSGVSIKIYQVMLFPKGGGYVLMTGLVGESLAALYLPKFKAMAKTYREVSRFK
jgi:hypothetical protein